MDIKVHGAVVDLHAIDATLLDGVAVPESHRSTEQHDSLLGFHTDAHHRGALPRAGT